MNVAIIGGGASGTLAALRIKVNNPNIDVTIYEKNNKILKKVATTGNGRCNLSNVDISYDKYQHQSIIKEMIDLGYKDSMLEFFHYLGLFTTVEDGRIYPKSNQAATVVELISKELFYKKVNVVLNKEITSIITKNDKYIVDGILYDKVLICVGTNASINNYSDELLKSLNLKMEKFTPALVGFKVKEDISSLFGVRANATVKLGEYSSKGEVMFKEDGVSGICVMDLSVFYDKDKILSFDFLDDYSFEMLKMVVNRKIKNDPYVHLHNLLFGSVNNKLLGMFNKGFPNSKVTTLEEAVLDSYLKQFKNFKLTITNTYPITNAHVAKGGIDLDELNLFEVKNKPNMFILGEATDQVGICGGFNLWYAFTSALIVADKICK
jgi:predicted Rossmann fold flavoprotein